VGLLNDRVAVVTGASRGIGRVISQTFGREGARVVCAARSRDLVEETADRIVSKGGEAIALVADLTDECQARRVIEGAVEVFGGLDVLVNNAGDSGPTAPVQDYPLDGWHYTLNSCLTSSYLCARFAAKAMIAAGGGSIVSISSMAGRRGLANRVGYCAAKAGQMGLTYGLAKELGQWGIRVNAIVPAAVAGDRIDRVIAAQAEVQGLSRERVRTALVDRAPLRRLATADDIAALAVFLASDQALSISGQCIPVTAGEPGS